MKTTFPASPPKGIKLGMMVASLLMGLAVTGAHAAGTAAGTTINNLATLSYSVGGFSQPNVGSSPTGNTSGAGTATTFLVDRKVQPLIQKQGSAAVAVFPGQTSAVSAFLLTNLGNDTEDFQIAGANLPNGTADPFGGAATDSFDATSCTVRVDGNGNGTYEPATDTATYVDELPANGTKTVFVLCDIPNTVTNGALVVGSVTATTYSGGSAGALGSLVSETSGADTAGVDTVFADTAGTDDAARDGKSSDRNAFIVSAAMLSITKSSQIVCDPINGTTNPKHIPGAIIRWTVTISNSAGAGTSATLAQVTDALNSNLTFDSNLVTGAGGAAGCSSASGTPENAAGKGFKLDVVGDTRPGTYPKFLTTAADADGATFSSGTATIDFSQGMPVETGYAAGELKPGEDVVVYFNTTIN